MRYLQIKPFQLLPSMHKYRRLFLVLSLQLIGVLPVLARTNAGQLRISFGKTGLIIYDLKTGLMNVYKSNVAVFSDV